MDLAHFGNDADFDHDGEAAAAAAAAAADDDGEARHHVAREVRRALGAHSPDLQHDGDNQTCDCARCLPNDTTSVAAAAADGGIHGIGLCRSGSDAFSKASNS